MEHLPANFGNSHTYADFTQPGGPGPGQLWDPGRPTDRYHGKDPVFETGGSDRASGKGPFSEFRQDCSNEGFWGNAANVNPQPGYDYGPGTPVGH